MENTTALLNTNLEPILPDIPLTQVKHGNTALLATTFFMILCCLGLHCFQMFVDLRNKKKRLNKELEYNVTTV